jgi:Cu(I)/Ag(I) efflux system membrane fusion protein
VRLRFIFLMVIVGLIAAHWDTIAAHWERWTRPQRQAAEAQAEIEYYCPMHPSVIRAESGNCPICGMPLVKRAKGEKPELPEGVVGRVQLSPNRIQLAGIATAEVGYRSLSRTIRTLGTIEVDERRVAHISARVAGRIEKLQVNFTGERVAAGAPLAEIYSPDLVSTQQEYLLAQRTLERVKAGGVAQAVADAEGVLAATRERLILWGIDEGQIDQLARQQTPLLRMTIHSPIGGIVTLKEVMEGQYVMEGTGLYTVADLSNVWMTAFVYESDIGRVEVGQSAQVTTRALPGRVFAGKVSFVWPSLDAATRTLKLRIDVANPQLALKPGMYGDAIVEAGAAAATSASAVRYICPMDPEVVSDRPGSCPICGMFLERVAAAPQAGVLAIPESAVIDTGTRKVVYLEREPGIFDAVEVELGPLGGGFYPVLAGLSPGDRIVMQGAFLVDAELRLNPGAAGSYFGASGGPSATGGSGAGGHQH